MKAEELDEQFQAMESDSHVRTLSDMPPPPAAKKKRITVAELNKTIDELTELVDVNVFDWLEKLDTRVRHFENAEAEEPDSRIGELDSRLDMLEKNAVSDRVHVNKDILNRLEILETTTAQHNTTLLSDVKRRLDTLEGAMGAIADAFRQHLEEISGEQPAAAQEIEFAKPPEPLAAVSTRAGDIEAVASVCVSMGDVLLIARALRDSQDINVMDKNKILNTACRMAGVEVTHGIQIRAGIHDTR